MAGMSVLQIAGSGLTAQRLRMDVTASNIANAEATRTQDGGPYRRESVVFTPRQPAGGMRLMAAGASRGPAMRGVQVSAIVQDTTAPREVLDPNHPDADADG